MNHFVTLTQQQIQHMRLLVRIQRIRTTRRALQAFGDKLCSLEQALERVITQEDELVSADILFQVGESSLLRAGHRVFTFTINEVTFRFFRSVVEYPYSTETLGPGPQSQQAQILARIEAEREGLMLALDTSAVEPLAINQVASQAKN